ncbi:MAG: HD domain-containing phosphohydrolase [Rubrivivax sp.]|nr:HD domain-containing phosphohydrolase [Rubrivivax sp.]
MHYADLSTVKHRLQLDTPLPFNVRDADRSLLLARGQRVSSREQLEALFTRGALVDLADLHTALEDISDAPREALPGQRTNCMTQVSQTLLQAEGESFGAALETAAAPVQALIERDPDLAIFQVLRGGTNVDMDYGTQRSLQTAITSFLVASRLGWDAAQTERVFKVALTMNLSMLELQGQLARQRVPPSDDQRRELRTHPMRSVRMLELAGVTDATWLQAVLRHHEVEDGSGYPSGCTEVGELASLARRADVYTSKLAARSTRDALAADVAGRQMFMQDPGHPMTAALVKEFGIYPPGCHVRLASGELAVVVARGATITAPVVACLTNANGVSLAHPVRRQTADRAHAVVAVVGEASVGARVPLEALVRALAD